ncbi:MAG TPA: ArgE/DapE family deacylase [Gemmatimonadaceae bacterium]|nr:ArgE/DapE family deacylase [Gemmatimonadaceae bacterium]
MRIARGDAVALARALIEIDSRNPTLVPGAPGEGGVARFLSAVLEDWGFAVELQDVAPERQNVIARIGPADTPALMLNGHLDVVGVEGMVHAPFDAELRDGRIYGRGAADMKGGIAAMCAAAATNCGSDATRQILVTAVVDEEYESLGMRALIASGITAEAAIVTEPTRLAICPAHRGFVWMDVTLRGRAAHGSRYDIGVDAITHAGLLLAELDALESTRETGLRHSLLGRTSLHASMIEGGVGMSTYPEVCRLAIERRTLPGETAGDALAELRDACRRVQVRKPAFSATVTLTTAQSPSDVAAGTPVMLMLERALAADGVAAKVEGLSAWTDAALLNEAGIPAVCFGPGDIALAHSAEEFVPIGELERAVSVLERVVREWCAGGVESR